MTYTHVKRFKRGAKWDDGTTRTCTRCRVDKNRGARGRAKQARVVAILKDGRWKVPVAYCDAHLPDDLKGTI